MTVPGGFSDRAGSGGAAPPTAGPASELDAKQRLPEMLELMVESIPEYAIILLDTAGHIATWNLTAKQLSGYTQEEIIGKHFSVLCVAEDVAMGKPARELEIAVREGRFQDEGWRVRKDGSRFWANVVITPLRDQGGELL